MSRPFVIYPAVDVQGGHAVRLTEGDPSRETVYFDDPCEAAAHWVALGARDLHVVDLDAALGRGDNREVIRAIARRTGAVAGGVLIEVGGGVRTLEVARSWLDLVHRVVIGTAAITDPEMVATLVREVGPDRVAVTVDARAGKVAVRGWTETTQIDAVDLASRAAAHGVRHLIYTDISRDGTLQGVDPAPVAEVRAAFEHVLVAGGGVATSADLDLYRSLGLDGAIVGRALYEGTVPYP
ncbi:1-(5-phosphoribosyl)-5-[(5-phosphoribosylamino)methylideneamino]imidazole-4-carboxamide isomerase [soil metagenome]|nr:1-(5-phosphoribosyl)-5-[(5-phosphoribosylamino)methylideneamino]imidazole-4-carboxamide isomerase [Trueperaceae bacterium]